MPACAAYSVAWRVIAGVRPAARAMLYSPGMGTWDDGIYDNDGALDELSRLVTLDKEETDAARLVAKIGLLAWLKPAAVTADIEALRGRIEGLAAEALAKVPEATRTALGELLADPEAATKKGSRSKAARSAIGGYSDGPRIDALVKFPEAEAVVAELADRAAGRLDRLLRPDGDLHRVAGGLAALGVLIDLKEAGLWPADAARVDRWRVGFAAIDRATKVERKFWAKYVRRVKKGFDLLAPTAIAAGTKPAPPVRRVLMELPVPTKYEHAKFGVGTVVTRTGSGLSETLELQFRDGTVRKILARFVVGIG
jgi:hypothetical protein